MFTINTAMIEQWQDGPVQDLLGYLGRSQRVFRQENRYLLVSNSEGRLETVSKPSRLGHMLHYTGILRVTSANGGAVAISTLPKYLDRLGMSLFYDHRTTAEIPTVDMVVKHPAFRLEGKDEHRALAPVPTGGGIMALNPEIIPKLLLHDVDPGYPHLRRWFSLLSWPIACHQNNLLAFILAGLVRCDIKSFPFLLIDAYKRNSGKTRVARAIGRFLTGDDIQSMVYTGNEAMLERRMGHVIGRPGPAVVAFDNVRAKRGQAQQIRSQLIAAMSTSMAINVDTKYRDPQPVFAPILMFTMNGAAVEQDLADRAIVVRLGTWTTDDAAPDEYCDLHLNALRAEACHLLNHLHVPQLDVYHTRHHQFEEVAVAATAKLGLPCDFDPASTGSVDPIASELYYLFTDIEASGRKMNGSRLSDLVGAINAAPELIELNELLRVIPRPKPGKAPALADWLELNICNKKFLVDSHVISFIIGKDSSNVRILTLNKEAK